MRRFKVFLIRSDGDAEACVEVEAENSTAAGVRARAQLSDDPLLWKVAAAAEVKPLGLPKR